MVELLQNGSVLRLLQVQLDGQVAFVEDKYKGLYLTGSLYVHREEQGRTS